MVVNPLGYQGGNDRSPDRVSFAVQRRLGQDLRSYYERAGEAPLPDQFKKLIAQLEQRLS